MANNVTLHTSVTYVDTGEKLSYGPSGAYGVDFDMRYQSGRDVNVHFKLIDDNTGNVLDEKSYIVSCGTEGIDPIYYEWDGDELDCVEFEFVGSKYRYTLEIPADNTPCIVDFKSSYSEASGEVDAYLVEEIWESRNNEDAEWYVVQRINVKAITDVYYRNEWQEGDAITDSLYAEYNGKTYTANDIDIEFVNVKLRSITNFVLSGDDRTIKKVRVSTDNGNTWGVLYQSSTDIYAEFDYIEYPNYSDYPEPPLVIPYNGSVTYNVFYNIWKDSGDGYNGEYLAVGLSFPYTFNYDDCSNGWNDFTTTVKYGGKTYELEFSADIALQGTTYYVIEPTENPVYLGIDTEISDKKSYVNIPYIIYEHDSETGERIGEYDNGSVKSKGYCFNDYKSNYSGSGNIAEVTEQLSVTIDDIYYYFTVKIILKPLRKCSVSTCTEKYLDICPNYDNTTLVEIKGVLPKGAYYPEDYTGYAYIDIELYNDHGYNYDTIWSVPCSVNQDGVAKVEYMGFTDSVTVT